MKLYGFLFLALLFTACGNAEMAEENLETEVNEAVAEADEAMDNATANAASAGAAAQAQASSFLQQTVQAVQSAGGDLTALAPATAVSNIEGWISRLGNIDGADPIVDDLKELKEQLTAEEIDGSEVSGLLSSMAEKTRSMEGKAPGLGTLANVLDAGAKKLGGM